MTDWENLRSDLYLKYIMKWMMWSVKLYINHLGSDFSDCCPHFYCDKLKHNISAAALLKCPFFCVLTYHNEKNSPKNHNQNNTYQASSQKFRQIYNNHIMKLRTWRVDQYTKHINGDLLAQNAQFSSYVGQIILSDNSVKIKQYYISK